MSYQPDGWKKEFDTESRSSTYDKVIDIFSLRRAERFSVLRQLLSGYCAEQSNILELGTGTGVLTELLMESYPNACVFTIEGAERMIEQARQKASFQQNEERVRILHADYSSPSWNTGLERSFDLIVTFDALHHLSHERKRELYREIFDLLGPGGSFLISDHVTSHGLFFEDSQYPLWIQEIYDNLKGVKKGSDILAALESISHWTYDDIQRLSFTVLQDTFTSNLKREGDNPMPIMEHIDVIRNIGFSNVTVEYRFANYAIISAAK